MEALVLDSQGPGMLAITRMKNSVIHLLLIFAVRLLVLCRQKNR